MHEAHDAYESTDMIRTGRLWSSYLSINPTSISDIQQELKLALLPSRGLLIDPVLNTYHRVPDGVIIFTFTKGKYSIEVADDIFQKDRYKAHSEDASSFAINITWQVAVWKVICKQGSEVMMQQRKCTPRHDLDYRTAHRITFVSRRPLCMNMLHDPAENEARDSKLPSSHDYLSRFQVALSLSSVDDLYNKKHVRHVRRNLTRVGAGQKMSTDACFK